MLRQILCICPLFLAVFSPKFASATGPPPVITAQPKDTNASILGSATFQVTVSSGTTITYQWRKNGTNVIGATQSSFTLSPVQASDAAVYSVAVTNGGGGLISANASLILLVPPTITTQPQSVAAAKNDDFSLSVTATGTATLKYQWYFNGAKVVGPAGSAASLALNNVRTNNAGGYYVVITNGQGAVTSSVATVTVDAPPFITSQPQGLTTVVGQNPTLSVTAIAVGSMSYIWRLNGTNITGNNSASLTLTNVQSAKAGDYAVVISNSKGSTTSDVASVTVTAPPSINSDPQNLSVASGDAAVFSVGATGTGPLAYQWIRNGTPIPGATNSVFSLTHALVKHGGNYCVTVTNLQGSATSAVATLAVAPPVLALAATNNVSQSTNGFTFQLSVPVGCTYVVEVSTDMQTWTSVITNVADTAVVTLTDTSATNFDKRFYKAFAP